MNLQHKKGMTMSALKGMGKEQNLIIVYDQNFNVKIPYPVKIFLIISSSVVIFSCVIDSLLVSDSIRGPSLFFFFSASNCL